MEKVLKYIREQKLLKAGDRVAVACSGGADSVALFRVLLDLREELGIVLSAAHFHHQIRGVEADADQEFVRALAAEHQIEFYLGQGNVPEYAEKNRLSLETAARELRHQWFAKLIRQKKADKIATAHTQDDQAETVLMRVLRGTGARGLAGIAPEQKERHLVRPLLTTTRSEIESYLQKIGQAWCEDMTNRDVAHTRNRVRHLLLPMLEREFNPAIRETLADLAELARAEEEYWRQEVSQLLPRLMLQGKPSRSGRSSSGDAAGVWALEISALRGLPLALQRQVIHAAAERLGISLEFKHIQQLMDLLKHDKPGKTAIVPGNLAVNRTAREIQFTQKMAEFQENYCYLLRIPGEIAILELGSTIRASLISAGKQKVSGYTGASCFGASLLNPSLLEPELKVRNWRAGDRFFPAHSQSPKKVKELLQPGRLGEAFSLAQRKTWPVIESAGQIVWMRGFPVSRDFAGSSSEDAILIEETNMSAEAQE